MLADFGIGRCSITTVVVAALAAAVSKTDNSVIVTFPWTALVTAAVLLVDTDSEIAV